MDAVQVLTSIISNLTSVNQVWFPAIKKNYKKKNIFDVISK